MNHPTTSISFSKQTPEDDDAAAVGLAQNPTALTAGESPDSAKSSEGSLPVDDPNYVSPSRFDVLLTDITAEYLRKDLPARFGVEYLSVLPKKEEFERAKNRKVHGKIVGNNKRFLINIPCRRESARNHPSSPKSPLPFVNVFFLVDTVSPFSFVCPEAMEALCGGPGNPIRGILDVELITGNPLELHLSPQDSHFSDINLLGGSALSVADIVSQNRLNRFQLEFNEI